VATSTVKLPLALESQAAINARLDGKKAAVFLDYDGTLTPIVERPDLAVMSEANRAVVRALSERCTVAIVSGRDRLDVEKLVGIDTLVYAGSHGFDIASPDGRTMQREEGGEFAEILEDVIAWLHREMDPIEGALVEPKKASVAAHYRLVAEQDHPKIKALVDAVLAKYDNLRVTPGKMVYEIQPKIDWHKGKAVLHVLASLGLDTPDVVPFYFGDDITDEDAFAALSGRGVGVLVADITDASTHRATDADYRVSDTDETIAFLDALAR